MTSIKFKIENSRRGFTLIELLVAIAIIGILAVTAIVNFGRNDDRDVRAEKERFTSFIREVQNKALAGERGGISDEDLSGGKLCGFGVKPSGSGLQSYYVKASGLDADCSALTNNSGINYTDTFSFSKGVSIVSGFSSDDDDKLFFLIPSGKAYLNGSDSFVSRDISLKKSDDVSLTVTIDQAGNIY